MIIVILGFKHFIITKMNINSRYNRDWRYHKEDRVWITRAPGMAPSEKTQSYERGTYYFFDVTNWRYAYSELLLLHVTKLRYNYNSTNTYGFAIFHRKVSKEFHLDYDKLEDRPSLPTNLSSSSGNVAPSGSGVAGVGATGSVTVHQPSSNSPAPPGMPGGGAPHASGPGLPPSVPSSASQHSPISGVVAPGINAVGGPGGPNL